MAAGSVVIALPAVNAQANLQNPARSTSGLFASKCGLCHQKGGWGTRTLAKRVPPEQAELLSRNTLPADYVKLVVRRGIGSMPQFTATDLTDNELDRLATWLEKRP